MFDPVTIGTLLATAGASIYTANRKQKFDEKMSNTAYQRGIEDMRKAGLNPILAYSQGGASSPAGTSPDLDFDVSSSYDNEAKKLQQKQIDALYQNTVSSTRKNDSEVKLLDMNQNSAKLSQQRQKLENRILSNKAKVSDVETALKANNVYQGLSMLGDLNLSGLFGGISAIKGFYNKYSNKFRKNMIK